MENKSSQHKLTFRRVINLLAPPKERLIYSEILLSAVGAFLGIVVVFLISHSLMADQPHEIFLISSIGASSFLLFAIPHGPFSQPWSVLGGHICSAIVGVTWALNCPIIELAVAGAVATAVASMLFLRCLHPPGAATALVAVLGGEKIHQLGYHFVFTPVLMNVLLLVVVAIIINNLMPNRRYPSSLSKGFFEKKSSQDVSQVHITQDELSDALLKLGIYVDISKEELEPIINTLIFKVQQRKIGDFQCFQLMSAPMKIESLANYDIWQYKDFQVITNEKKLPLGFLKQGSEDYCQLFPPHAFFYPHQPIIELLQQLKANEPSVFAIVDQKNYLQGMISEQELLGLLRKIA